MALIRCEHCGHRISDKAPFCPKCGYILIPVSLVDNKTTFTNSTNSPVSLPTPPPLSPPVPTPFYPEELIKPSDPKPSRSKSRKSSTAWIISVFVILLITFASIWVFYLLPLYESEVNYIYPKPVEELRDIMGTNESVLTADMFVKSLNNEYNDFVFRKDLEEKLIQRGFKKTNHKTIHYMDTYSNKFKDEESYETTYTKFQNGNETSVKIKDYINNNYSVIITFSSYKDLNDFVTSIENLGFFPQDGRSGYYVSYPYKPTLVFHKQGEIVTIYINET